MPSERMRAMRAITHRIGVASCALHLLAAGSPIWSLLFYDILSLMKLSRFSYTLPQTLIAQQPVHPRDVCRLMSVDLASGSIRHLIFSNLPDLLRAGDVLVFNDSKVIPARLYGKKSTGGKVEIFIVKKESDTRWIALVKNITEKESGRAISLAHSKIITATPIRKYPDGTWAVEFSHGSAAFDRYISRYGETPTPPYIKKHARMTDYQTIYAKTAGSVAAPTAGLHFTKRLMNKLRSRGIEMHTVTLHVGIGTFLPIRTERIENHRMHPEYAAISATTARAIRKAKRQGRRVIAVGTTAVRTLEAFATSDGKLTHGSKEVALFIYPGYRFRMVDGMITNFHLPCSTLLVLVCAFAEWKKRGGMKQILNAYKIAGKKKYRFFSFGDAMMISS